MRSVPDFIRLALLLLFATAMQSYAQTVRQNSDLDALTLLRKTQSAASSLSYSGTFIYLRGSQVRTSRITHAVQGGAELEKLEVLDGRPREYIRKNDRILSYLPDTRLILVEKRVMHDVFPALLSASPAELAQNYTIAKGNPARIAGRQAQSVVMQPKDDRRYGYLLWIDDASGLLLRIQTLGPEQDVLEQISFVQLEVGKIDPRRLKSGFSDTRGWRTENTGTRTVDLSPWIIRSLPAGFRRVREVRRTVSDSDAAERPRGSAPRREVSQIIFSDGLAAISLFIEPLGQNRSSGLVRQGAMNILSKRHADFWLTIVGEVPPEAIQQVADSIEYRPGK